MPAFLLRNTGVYMEFKPKWIAWEITRRCNLRCVHCRSSSELEAKGHPDFSREEAFRILENIAGYAKPVVVLSGGEPLIREDVFDIARYGTEKGLRMCLATNGTLVNDTICEKIKDSGIRIVSLSLDGSTEAIHDINSSFTKRNQEDIPSVYRLAKELGATAWYMFMIVPTGRGEEIMNELTSKEDYEDILEWHYQMEKDEHDMLVRPTCAPHYYRVVLQKAKEEKVKFERRTLKFSTGGSKGCIAGQLICLINVDGDVFPCSYFPKSAGNVKVQSFQEIWEDSELFKELRDFKKYKGRCGSCEYINVCGGCRARAYSLHGDFLEEEPFCNYMPVKMQKKTIRG
jgi:radical SAM protein with 4Fe4S-binding SPASM domain